MERFNALGRGTQMMLVGGVLLFIVLFFPWQDFDVGGLADEFGVDATFSGWRGVGVILGLLTIVLLAWVIVRLAAVDIPLPVSTAMTAALIGTLILIFAVIKMLTILGDETTIWSWVGPRARNRDRRGRISDGAGSRWRRHPEERDTEPDGYRDDGCASADVPPPPPASEAAPYEPPSSTVDPEPSVDPEPDLTPDEPRDDRQT